MRCALVLLLLLLGGSAAAEPMVTKLDALIKETRIAVIATFPSQRPAAKTYTLTVERALLGTGRARCAT